MGPDTSSGDRNKPIIMVDGTHLELYIKSKACKSKIEYSCICCLLGPQSGKHRKLKLIRAQYLFMNTEIKSFVL
jgi:hypothetical protein